MSSPRPAAADLISIARIARPQGLRGEVIADVLTDFPERFTAPRKVWGVRPSGQIEEFQLERSWMNKTRVVLKFVGCDDRNQAETLRDVRLGITNEELRPLPPDTYYDFDLAGCEVVATSGEVVGQVEAVERHGAAPLLKVRGDGREHLIPLVLSICVEIDIARKRIVVAPPDGLLDL
ncbi:MAG: ribosome maturation factor RimM [Acidobacteriota bacterium]